MSQNISIKKAVSINFISKYSSIFIQLILNSILARILTPHDYGIVTVISVFIAFFTLIADMGIGPAIIQDRGLTERDISSIFKFTFFTSIIIGIIFILFSIPMSWFYNNNVYIPLGGILSISIIFNVLNIVPNSILLKNKMFKIVAIRTVIITLISGIITIILALMGLKYYALVINSVLVSFFTFIINFKTCSIKVYAGFSKDSLVKIKHYSSYQFAFSFVNYFSRNLDNLLIGKILGQAELGFYDKAYKLMLYPVQNLTHVITPVLHPILSDFQHNTEYIYKKYCEILKILSLLGVFVSVFCFFASKEIIYIMFGSQWDESVPTFKILSLIMWIQILLSSIGSIFQSMGATNYLFRAGLISSITNVIAIIVGLTLGKIEYIATLLVISFTVNFFVNYYLLVSVVMKKSFFKFIQNFIPEVFIVFFMSLLLILFSIEIRNILISLIYKALIALLGYIVGLVFTKQISIIKTFLKLKR